MPEPSPLDPSILDRLPVGIFVAGTDWRITLWNRTLSSWTSIAAAEALGRDARTVLPRLADPRYLSRLEGLMEGGPPVVFSYQLHGDLFPDARGGAMKRVRYTTASSMAGGAGILFTIEDRTEVASLLHEARVEISRRLAVEEELRSTIAAKEMLLRETSHRVKNNLAMIVSLIDLDAQGMDDETMRARLIDLESRIESIALIHDLLYKSEFGTEIRLDEYLRKLCAKILSAFSVSPGEMALEFETEEVQIDVDSTLYVGIIAAELVTNALKYARVPGRACRLFVRLASAGPEGGIELLVADDGPGIAPGSHPAAFSLGFGMIKMLCQSLKGTMELLAGPGARILVRIPPKRS